MDAKRHNLFFFFIWLLVFFSVFPLKRAFAYLDPGTGSYVIQILIGAAFGAGYVIKSYGRRILSFFTRTFSRKQKTSKEK